MRDLKTIYSERRQMKKLFRHTRNKLRHKANIEILKGHLGHCVKDAIKNDNADEKLDEIMKLFEKVAK